nr:CbtA family protein [Motilibacter deserti]
MLVRGMLAGLVAGLAALIVASVFGEPQVRDAIALEEASGGHSHGAEPAGAAHAEEEDELVSRGVQSTIGLATGVGVYGVAVGGIFALAFAFVYGRVGQAHARATSGVLGLAAFAAVILVPFLKYPGNPPGVGDGETIGRRTSLWLAMLLLSLAAAGVALIVGRALAPHGAWTAVPAAGLAFVVAAGVAMWAMPGVDEIPAGYSADLLWKFRLASLGVQAALWSTLALVFGALAERLLEPRRAQTPSNALA